MAELTWEELDRCGSDKDIAKILRAHNIKGQPCINIRCPLANATGWRVLYKVAFDDRLPNAPSHNLTQAEQDFITAFDSGIYKDLEEEDRG